MPRSKTLLFYIIVGLILVIVAFIAGNFIGSTQTEKRLNAQITDLQKNRYVFGIPSVVQSQVAVAGGKIVSTTNNSITLQGSDLTTETFPLDSQFYVLDTTKNHGQPIQGDLSAIKVGQQVIINLGLKNKQYVADFIQYPSSTPPVVLPKIASSSSAKRNK